MLTQKIRGVDQIPSGRYTTRARAARYSWVNVGTFDTPERASLAVRLFEYWIASGHNPHAIPRQPRTVDAI